MEKLPETINVSNKDNFSLLFIDQKTRRFRKEVVNFLYKRKNETDFIDLDNFNREHIQDMKVTHKIVELVMSELAALGWYTYLGFGDTGLYIFSTEEKPNGVY